MTDAEVLLDAVTVMDRLGNESESTREVYEEFWPLHVRVLMTAIFSLLSLAGIVGNVLVVTVVFRVRGMITPTNCYLVSLAISDCLFFVATTPSELSYLHFDESDYMFGSVGCALFSYLPYLAINTSSLSIAAFTIERYIGICHPIRARYLCTVKRAKTIIFAIWIFSITYNSPWLYLARVKKEEHGEYSCNFTLERDHFTYKAIYLGDLVTFYVIPMILYIIMYGKIGYVLNRNEMKAKVKKAVNPESSMRLMTPLTVTPSNQTTLHEYAIAGRRNSQMGKSQVVKMLSVIVAIFGICWLPYRAMVTYNSFATKLWKPDWYIYLSKTMIFFNCAVNPIVYNLMSARFRNSFRKLFAATPKKSYQETSKHSKSVRFEYAMRTDGLMNNGATVENAVPASSVTSNGLSATHSP